MTLDGMKEKKNDRHPHVHYHAFCNKLPNWLTL